MKFIITLSILFSSHYLLAQVTQVSNNIVESGSDVGISIPSSQTEGPWERLQIGNGFFFHDGGHKTIGMNYSTSNGLYDNSKYGSEIRFMPESGKLSICVSPGAGSGPNPWNDSHVGISIKPNLVGIGILDPEAPLHVKRYGQEIKFLTGSNSSAYTLKVGLNDDGVNFENNSNDRGFNFKNANGSLLRIDAEGNTVIGAEAGKENYKLSVNGKIVCDELLVELHDEWGDFVFEEDYNLLSLEETEAFILQHKHLPNIPSADSISQVGGIEIGEMQRLQMIKIEELTLHLIKINKEKEALKAEAFQLETNQTSLEIEASIALEENKAIKEELSALKAEIEALLKEHK